MTLKEVIGRNIEQVRIAKKLSQQELCAKLEDVSQPRLSLIEQGKTGITIATLEKIAKALSISPMILLNDSSKNALDLSQTIEAINLLPLAKRKALLEIVEAYIQRELGK